MSAQSDDDAWWAGDLWASGATRALDGLGDYALAHPAAVLPCACVFALSILPVMALPFAALLADTVLGLVRMVRRFMRSARS